MTKIMNVDQSVKSIEVVINKILQHIEDEKKHKKSLSADLKAGLMEDDGFERITKIVKTNQKQKKEMRLKVIEDDEDLKVLCDDLSESKEVIKNQKETLSEMLEKWQKKTGKNEYQSKKIVKQLSLFNS